MASGSVSEDCTMSAKMITDTDFFLELKHICNSLLRNYIYSPLEYFSNSTIFRTEHSTLQPSVNSQQTQQLATSTHTEIHADTQTHRRLLDHT